MKDEYKKYLYAGITAFAVIALSILVFFGLFRLSLLKNGVTTIIGILMPIIYGAVFAYLLNPVYNFFKRFFHKMLSQKMKSEDKARVLAKAFSTLVSLILMLVVVGGLLWLVLPQVFVSIMGIVEALPTNVRNVSNWLEEVLKNNPAMEQTILGAYDNAMQFVEGWLKTDLMPNVERLLTGLSSGLMSVVMVLYNVLIGLIVTVYVLNSKDTFTAQSKKILYSICDLPVANALLSEVRFVHRVFGGFISGKLLDSLIIGIICFVVISFLKMPYVMLISVIIGVTNIIPFFGPFIGAVPSALLVLLVSPYKCLIFLIFVIILQQFDGNILGPKILGDSTGLPSFWVLFSILLFGGLFGFVGMIIGVPTFAVIYHLITIFVNKSLRKKKLTTITDAYLDLDLMKETDQSTDKNECCR